ncbi:uncharacterized protein H6S33_003818 [Morchella sextelata]|uniref:uncharacterized protein n=1 Tax=Morchella sextelata TaxID=1174677 RepID=UPI001D040838|nr:uncharacterized protein H6S33_003818 [Morchella sextelata]KAH0606157.1 hypothetical protein H6S33_003818 [Morchella sextelata]
MGECFAAFLGQCVKLSGDHGADSQPRQMGRHSFPLAGYLHLGCAFREGGRRDLWLGGLVLRSVSSGVVVSQTYNLTYEHTSIVTNHTPLA